MTPSAPSYGRTLVRMQFGSHVYGTNLPTSDLDFKAVHVPPAFDILLGTAQQTINVGTKADTSQRNGPEDVDFESFALQKYMRLLLEGQTVALTMLFTPEQWIRETSEEWDLIRAGKALWLHRGVSAFAGYCRQQASKYGIKGSRIAAARAAVELFDGLIALHGHGAKLRDHWQVIEGFAASGLNHVALVDGVMSGTLPCRLLEVCSRKVQEHVTVKEARAVFGRVFDEYGARARQAETNEGVDWKALMHAIRVSREAAELLTDQHITYPRPEADLLLKVRRAELPYKRVAEIVEEGMEELERCQAQSALPDLPDHETADQLILSIYRRTVMDWAAPTVGGLCAV